MPAKSPSGHPNSWTLLSALKACCIQATKEQATQLPGGNLVKLKCLDKAMGIHSEALSTGCNLDIFNHAKLIALYSKCGTMFDARTIFDKMHEHDVVSWTTLIQGYAENGEEYLALDLFYHQFQYYQDLCNARTFISALNSCATLASKEKGELLAGKLVKRRSMEQGMAVHSLSTQMKFYSDIFLANTLINLYRTSGSLLDSRAVFDRMSFHDEVTWTLMIQAYTESEEEERALELFNRFVILEIRTSYPGVYTAALHACVSLASKEPGERIEGRTIKLESLGKGRRIHSHARAAGTDVDNRVACTLVNMYGKCGSLVEAYRAFQRMEDHRQPDVVSWNSLLGATAENGEPEMTLKLYEEMRSQGCTANSRTLSSVLKACSQLATREEGVEVDGKLVKACSLERGASVHAEARKFNWDVEDRFLASALVEMYVKCGSFQHALGVLNSSREFSTVSWNCLGSGYVERGEEERALELVSCMRERNSRTYVAAFNACAGLAEKGEHNRTEALSRGSRLHSEAESLNFTSDMYVACSLLKLYVKCGEMAEARAVFEGMADRDTASWNVMILGYAENDRWSSAVEMFDRMSSTHAHPDGPTYAAVLKACRGLAHLEYGKALHARLCTRLADFLDDTMLVTCLVEFYAWCGRMTESQLVFDSAVPSMSNTVNWSAMISGYSRQGDVDSVLRMFDMMREQGRRPNELTLTCVLTACSHAGLVSRAWSCFRGMERLGMSPGIDHYHCMIDVLARANRIEEAVEMAERMPFEATVVTWKTVLSGCVKWKNVEMGRRAFECVVKLDEGDVSAHNLLANMYSLH